MSPNNKFRIVLVIVVALALALAFMMKPEESPVGPSTGLVPSHPLTVAERQTLELGTNAAPASAGKQPIVKKDPVTERNRRELNIMFNSANASTR